MVPIPIRHYPDKMLVGKGFHENTELTNSQSRGVSSLPLAGFKEVHNVQHRPRPRKDTMMRMWFLLLGLTRRRLGRDTIEYKRPDERRALQRAGVRWIILSESCLVQVIILVQHPCSLTISDIFAGLDAGGQVSSYLLGLSPNSGPSCTTRIHAWESITHIDPPIASTGLPTLTLFHI